MKKVMDAVFVFGILCIAFAILSTIQTVKDYAAELFPIEDQPKIVARELPRKITYLTREKVALSDKEKDCLARNVFYEAGIEPKRREDCSCPSYLQSFERGQVGQERL